MYALVAAYMVIYVPIVFMHRLQKFYEVRAIAESLVIVGNIAILVFIRHKLRNFKSAEMTKTVCSIYIQFFLFLFTYSFICICDTLFGIVKMDFMAEFGWQQTIEFTSDIIPLIPIVYVLYIHRKTLMHDSQGRTIAKNRLRRLAREEEIDFTATSSKSKSNMSQSRAFYNQPTREKGDSGPTVKTSSYEKDVPLVT